MMTSFAMPAPHHAHHTSPSLNRLAVSATLHCLAGCAAGEVLGMVLGAGLAWSNASTIAASVGLAFVFGYGLTLLPLLRSGLPVRVALGLALAADTLSIASMEFVDNAVMLVIPGAMEAGITDLLFWGSMALAVVLGGVAAFPVNRWLIARGRGHALVHVHHGGH